MAASLFADAASGTRVTLQKLWFSGDIRSFLGPFHGEGAFVVGDELYGYRISGGRVDEDGGLKVKLGVDPSNHPLTTEIEGTLSLAGGAPQFDGKLALTRPVGAALARGETVMSDPWHLTGKVRADPPARRCRSSLCNTGRKSGRSSSAATPPHLRRTSASRGAMSARQIDVDRALAEPDVTHRPPLIMIRNFVETFVATVKPPLPAESLWPSMP